MKAAKGQGIVSSIVFESDDLDEIDWEFVGTDTTHVQSNFFGKGNTTSYDRVEYIEVDSPQDTFHTYSVDWNSDRINWIIDGSTVRTLTFDNDLTVGGKNYPQTPMRIKLGNWCGGCKGMPQGTITWAGGATTFQDAPYTMGKLDLLHCTKQDADFDKLSNPSRSRTTTQQMHMNTPIRAVIGNPSSSSRTVRLATQPAK